MIGRLVLLAAVQTLAVARPGPAQQGTTTVEEEKPGLLEQAMVSPDSARTIALGVIRGSKVHSARIERDDDRLVYWFDMSYQDLPGSIRAEVDAITGEFVRARHGEVDFMLRRDTLAASNPKTPVIEGAPGLLQQAKISPDSARAVVLAMIHGGVIRSARIAQEDEGLVYWFGMTHPRFPGPIHAAVDAMTGKFIRAWQSLPGSDAGPGAGTPRSRPEAEAARFPAEERTKVS
jgi:uncharacterized membrane protein YkoI